MLHSSIQSNWYEGDAIDKRNELHNKTHLTVAQNGNFRVLFSFGSAECSVATSNNQNWLLFKLLAWMVCAICDIFPFRLSGAALWIIIITIFLWVFNTFFQENLLPLSGEFHKCGELLSFIDHKNIEWLLSVEINVKASEQKRQKVNYSLIKSQHFIALLCKNGFLELIANDCFWDGWK